MALFSRVTALLKSFHWNGILPSHTSRAVAFFMYLLLMTFREILNVVVIESHCKIVELRVTMANVPLLDCVFLQAARDSHRQSPYSVFEDKTNRRDPMTTPLVSHGVS